MALVSFGEALIDLLPAEQPQNLLVCPGGAPANVAVAFARQGGESFFVGGLSTDAMGQLLLSSLQQYQVNTHFCVQFHDAPTPLALVSLSADGERSFQFYRRESADISLRMQHLDPALFGIRGIFHLCSNTLTDAGIAATSVEVVEQALRHGQIISFDVNLRLMLWPADQRLHLIPRVRDILCRSQIVKLASEELSYLADSEAKTPHDWIAELLGLGVQLVVVTDGGDKIRVITPHEQFSVSPPATRVVDTTGAGDAFIGGLLADLDRALNAGLTFADWMQAPSLLQAVSLASRCGAKACQQKGAFEAMPARD